MIQQFYFTLNCQDLQSTRNCITYNHLNLSWKFGDVTWNVWWGTYFFKTLFGGYASKAVWRLPIGHSPRPWEAPAGPATEPVFIWNKGRRQATCEQPRFLFSLCLPSPTRSWRICLPSQGFYPELLGERNAVSRGHVIPEGARPRKPSRWGLFDPRLFAFYSMTESFHL